jgi:SH3 domain protein
MNVQVNFKKSTLYSLFAAILLPVLSTPAHAERAYVSDKLTVPVRSGHTMQHRIKKYLNSGTTLEIIELSEDQQWSHVNAAGTDGWVRNQYIQSTPTAKLLLVSAQNELARLKESTRSQNQRINALSSELNTLKKQHGLLSKTHKSTEEEFNDLKQLSANAIRIDKANSELIKDNQLMKVDMEQLKAERDKYKSDNFNKGLQLGAGIMIIGFLIGYIMKSKGNKRTSSW